MKRFLLLIIGLCLVSAFPALAQDAGDGRFRATEYPLPRFASVGQDKSYIRKGPGSKYPIEWVLRKKYLPVEIVNEFDNWRKVMLHDGDVGWMHLSQLSGRRTALVKSDDLVELYAAPSRSEKIVAYLEPNVVVSLKNCSTDWCLIDASGYKGWMSKDALWGVYRDELIRG